MIGKGEKHGTRDISLGISSGKQFLDMKEEDHGQIEFEPKDGLDIFDYSNLTLSALCGCIDLDLQSVVVWQNILAIMKLELNRTERQYFKNLSPFVITSLIPQIELYYPPLIIPYYNNEQIKIMELMYSMLNA